MCQFKTGEAHDCHHCFRTVTLDGFESVSAEYAELQRRGWVIIPTTGTWVFCSVECHAGGWRPNPKHYGRSE